MKWSIATLILLMCMLSYGQELSLAIPVTPNKRADAGAQIATLDDGFLIAGKSFCHDISNDYCLGLLKVDGQGNKIWSKVFDGNPESGLEMKRTLLLIGDTAYVAADVWKNGYKEVRVMSFDLDGNLSNQKDLAIPYTSQLGLRGMVQDGNKLLVYGEVANNGHRVFIEVLDLQFNLLEEHFIGNPSYDKRFMELNKLSGAGYVLAYGEGGFLQVSVVITKLDENFNITFTKKTLQAAEEFTSVNIYETDDKGFMLAWQKDLMFSLSDTFPFPTAIYKLDSMANVEWEYVFAHKAAKQHISTVKVSGGKMLGIGATDYYGVHNIYPERWADGWCFLIDTGGNLLWERSIADIRDSYGGRLWHGLETDNGFVLVGDIDKINPSGVPFLNDPEVWFLTLDENGCWNGNCEKYIVITGDTTSITDTKETKAATGEIVAYPNPTDGIITIECENCKAPELQRTIQVFDSSGRKIMETSLNAPKSIINLTHLDNGVYYIYILSSSGQYLPAKKIVVLR
jgi:type IX secretion system substrate protein